MSDDEDPRSPENREFAKHRLTTDAILQRTRAHRLPDGADHCADGTVEPIVTGERRGECARRGPCGRVGRVDYGDGADAAADAGSVEEVRWASATGVSDSRRPGLWGPPTVHRARSLRRLH